MGGKFRWIEVNKAKSTSKPVIIFLTGEECPILDAESKERWDKTMRTVQPRTKERTIFYKIHDFNEFTKKINMWTDQTGQFPKKSSRGNQHVMVMAKSDSKTVIAEPMKNRTSGEMIREYQVLIDWLNAAGISQLNTYWIMRNQPNSWSR